MTDSLRYELAAQILGAVALFLILRLGLLPAVLSGLLIYQLVHLVGLRFRRLGVGRGAGNLVALTLLAVVFVFALTAGVMKLASLVADQSDSPVLLLTKMAEIIDTARNRLPPGLVDYVPESVDEVKAAAVAWLREHAGQLQQMGQNFGRTLAHILIGMIIGGFVAVSRSVNERPTAPLAAAMADRVRLFSEAFRRIVFAQLRISALNTFLTGLYLGLLLPSVSLQLPLTKTMIAATFVCGLLPVVGNLISNTIIVVVSLSVSPIAATSSLVFLVLIHKLEYFANARIVGAQIQARAWELLIAMLVMESAFGLPGVVAAPIYYCYAKDELAARKLI